MSDPEVIYLKKTRNPRTIVPAVFWLPFFVGAWCIYDLDPNSAPLWQRLATIAFVLFVFLLWLFPFRQTVRVTGENLEVWLDPLFNRVPTRIPLGEIAGVKPVKAHWFFAWNFCSTYPPGAAPKGRFPDPEQVPKNAHDAEIASYYGIYCGPHALRITRIDGRVFNVGTPEPEVLASVIDDARPGVTIEVTDSSGSN